tara:strand:- start:395 stop:3184 length:2790 start_codon:yes stop_codon:yes gene_type:complete
MSVQLILYPQENPLFSFLVDAKNFSTLNAGTNTDTTNNSNLLVAVQQATPPTIPGAWYRFRYTGQATPAQAAASAGILTLNSVTGGITFCGVYQQLSGLIPGESYTLTLDINATTSGYLVLANMNQSGATTTQQYFTGLTAGSFTYNFTAHTSSDTIYISYANNNVNANLLIDQATITGEIVQKEFEGQVICDLYEEEEIPLTLSVDDFKNVAEKVQSYSKDFNLPATKRNNKIFGNIFEITRTVANPYDFNPYAKTRAVLKQDGFMLFDGFLKLIDIQEREGEISYNVNLYAQTIALADTLKNRTFDLMDFSELEHTYSKVAIKASWYLNGLPLTNPLPTGTYAGTAGTSVTDVLKYPFVDWSGQILIANGATGNSATAGSPELTTLEQGFRPFIQVKYLIDRIFAEAGYTYTSTLFDTGKFKRLFMDFNWGGDTMPSVIGETTYTATYKYGTGAPAFGTDTTFITLPLIDSTSTGGQTNSHVPPDYNTSGADIYKIVATTDNQVYNIDYTWVIYNDASGTGNNDTIQLQWKHYDSSTGVTTTKNYTQVYAPDGKKTPVTGRIQVALDTGDKLWAEYAGSESYSDLEVDRYLGRTGATVTFNITSSLVTSGTINSLRGEINQWEFLKGIFTMFNLVTIQDDSDAANIIIKPYSEVFINNTRGTTLKDRSINFDWTDKVDLKDIQLTPLNDLKKRTIFKYEEDDDDYIFNMYKKSTRGHLYGSKVFSAEGLTLLEGDEEVVASPFAATVSKPLGQSFTALIVPTIYSKGDDGTTEPFDNLPRILYNHTGTAAPIDIAPLSYYIPEQNGGGSENVDEFFTFSHLTDIPTVVSTPPVSTDTFDYNFGEAQYIQPIGQTSTLNLFNTYWLPYYNQLYNPDTKTMTLKVNLTAGDIAEFEFSDLVMIKNRAYRVNRIDYKPKDLSTVEFILIP